MQANEIATMILNGEIDVEMAQKYSAVIRVATQCLSLESARSRMMKQEPDLSLSEYDE